MDYKKYEICCRKIADFFIKIIIILFCYMGHFVKSGPQNK